jgi:chromosome partitioning protein
MSVRTHERSYAITAKRNSAYTYRRITIRGYVHSPSQTLASCGISDKHPIIRDAGGKLSVLTVAGQKGGSGKTNLVRNLALHFALDGYTVGVVDADLIQQHSSEFFANRRKEGAREIWTPRDDIPGLVIAVWDWGSLPVPNASIVLAPQVDQDAIGEVIQALTEAIDVVICDLQGTASVAMIHAIHYADLVLIPVQPSNDDLKSAHSTARHVAQAGKSGRREIPYRIVISRASTGFRPEVEKIIDAALENASIPRLKTPVFERTAFKRASFSRVAPIFEEPTGGAAENMKALYVEVKRVLAETITRSREIA